MDQRRDKKEAILLFARLCHNSHTCTACQPPGHDPTRLRYWPTAQNLLRMYASKINRRESKRLRESEGRIPFPYLLQSRSLVSSISGLPHLQSGPSPVEPRRAGPTRARSNFPCHAAQRALSLGPVWPCHSCRAGSAHHVVCSAVLEPCRASRASGRPEKARSKFQLSTCV